MNLRRVMRDVFVVTDFESLADMVILPLSPALGLFICTVCFDARGYHPPMPSTM
jgi:hypothetical protein